jgi:hypothetical protein
MATTADSDPGSDSARRVPVERRRLPAAPLLEVVAAQARRRQLPLDELLGNHDDSRNPWLLQALRRAEASGEITVQAGEHVCDLLGWHPRMVWGEVYERAIAEPQHTASAPAGTATGYRQGCRCLDCREANRAAIARSRRDSPKAGERLA